MAKRIGRNFVAVVLLALLAFPVFGLNAFATAEDDFFSNWQLESDALVLGGMQARSIGVDIGAYGLALSQPNQLSTLDYAPMSTDALMAAEPRFIAYPSQLGLQGYWADFLSGLGMKTLHEQQLVNALLFSIIFAVFVVLVSALTGKVFAAILGLVAISSAWLVTAAHSLFWVAWSWYLPLVLFAIYCLTANRKLRYLFATLTVLAFVFRFGSGYEFLTNFALFAAALPILSKLLRDGKTYSNWRRAIVDSFTGLGLAVLGFVITYVCHSSVRGNGNILAGAIAILRQDILRRTYGSAADFENPEIQASLTASTFDTLHKYLFGWKTDFLRFGFQSPFDFVFGTTAPWAMICFAVLCILLLFVLRIPAYTELSAVLLIGFTVSFSWYFLAKGHSFIHTQIDYVLWYLLLAPVLFYIPVWSAISIWRIRKQWRVEKLRL